VGEAQRFEVPGVGCLNCALVELAAGWLSMATSVWVRL